MKGARYAHNDLRWNRDDRNCPGKIPAGGWSPGLGIIPHTTIGAPAGGRQGDWLGWTVQPGLGRNGRPGGWSGQPGGERLSKWPWTKRQKSRFWDSRVEGGHALVEAIQAASKPPKVLIQASGVNYYGPHDLTPVSEAEAPGNDFLGKLCRAWEASTEPVEKMGVRSVIVRSAIVLSTHAGILPIMLFPVKLFAGGPLGRGRQGLPWIHLDDEVAAIRFLLENESASGPFNLTSPTPISSADFLRAAAKTLHRPYWLPVPAFILRLVLGEMSTLVLDGVYLQPGRLQGFGFNFRFGTVEAALRDLLRG